MVAIKNGAADYKRVCTIDSKFLLWHLESCHQLFHNGLNIFIIFDIEPSLRLTPFGKIYCF